MRQTINEKIFEKQNEVWVTEKSIKDANSASLQLERKMNSIDADLGVLKKIYARHANEEVKRNAIGFVVIGIIATVFFLIVENSIAISIGGLIFTVILGRILFNYIYHWRTQGRIRVESDDKLKIFFLNAIQRQRRKIQQHIEDKTNLLIKQKQDLKDLEEQRNYY